MNIRAKLVAAIDASDLTDRKLSVRATGSPDAVRNLRRGAIPRADNLERLCHAMGLELQITRAPKPPTNKDATPALDSPTAFTENRELPVYEWTDPSNDGYIPARRGTESGASAPRRVRRASFLRADARQFNGPSGDFERRLLSCFSVRPDPS